MMDETLSEQIRRLARRAQYEFDQTMAAGPLSLIGWLALASVAVILVAALFLAASHIAPPEDRHGLSFLEAFWQATMRTIDAASVAGDNGWAFRIVMLIVTMWGLFVVSSLIGLISAGVQSQLDVLRKGRSFVLERNHIVILNWSNSIFDIVRELIVAHQGDRRFTVVILASKDKVAMEDEIATKVKPPSNVRIVCRSGDPGDLHDLEIVNLEHAGSIVVLSQDDKDDEDADAQNIKIVLALVHGPARRQRPYQISAEFRAPKSAQVARDIGNGEVQAIVPDDLISRVIVHSSRHTGMSAIYSELLDFEGVEFHAVALAPLAGKSFGEALSMLSAGTLLGVCHEHGEVELNPDMDAVITAGARVIVIAEDAASIGVRDGPPPAVEETAIRPRPTPREHPERVLILGWNRRGSDIARELCNYMAPGSSIDIVASTPSFAQDMAALTLPNDDIALNYKVADTRDRPALEAVDAAGHDRTIVLSCSDTLPTQAADTQTLVTLLHLRDIATDTGKRGILVSEMADIRNRQLAVVTRADDFVTSNRLVSLLLAQAAESEFTTSIFTELLDEDGSEIYMRPVETMVAIERPVDFHTIVEAGRRRGETAFGYTRPRGDRSNPSGVVLNPAKDQAIAFKAGDFVVVLARE
jgi:voltage-gated potassium channel Kch